MISPKLAQRRVDNPLKGCEYFCSTQLNDLIIGSGDEANNDDGLFGFHVLTIDPYFQGKFLKMFGDVTVWINDKYKISNITER